MSGILHHQLRQKMQVQNHGINIGNLHPSILQLPQTTSKTHPASWLMAVCRHCSMVRPPGRSNDKTFSASSSVIAKSSWVPQLKKNCEKLGEFCRKCLVISLVCSYFLVQFFFRVRTWDRHQVDIDIFGQHHNSNPNRSLHSKLPTSNQPNLKKKMPFPHLDPKVLGSKTSGISGTCVCGTWFASPRPQMLVDTTGMPRSCASVTIKPKASG